MSQFGALADGNLGLVALAMVISAVIALFGHTGWVWFTIRKDIKDHGVKLDAIAAALDRIEDQHTKREVNEGRHHERLQALERRMDRLERSP